MVDAPGASLLSKSIIEKLQAIRAVAQQMGVCSNTHVSSKLFIFKDAFSLFTLHLNNANLLECKNTYEDNAAAQTPSHVCTFHPFTFRTNYSEDLVELTAQMCRLEKTNAHNAMKRT